MQAITEQDWQTLPEYAQREIYDFFLFIQSRIATMPLTHDAIETQAFSNHSAATVEDWLNQSEDEIWT